jgi:hypothetical protein
MATNGLSHGTAGNKCIGNWSHGTEIKRYPLRTLSGLKYLFPLRASKYFSVTLRETACQNIIIIYSKDDMEQPDAKVYWILLTIWLIFSSRCKASAWLWATEIIFYPNQFHLGAPSIMYALKFIKVRLNLLMNQKFIILQRASRCV